MYAGMEWEDYQQFLAKHEPSPQTKVSAFVKKGLVFKQFKQIITDTFGNEKVMIVGSNPNLKKLQSKDPATEGAPVESEESDTEMRTNISKQLD